MDDQLALALAVLDRLIVAVAHTCRERWTARCQDAGQNQNPALEIDRLWSDLAGSKLDLDARAGTPVFGDDEVAAGGQRRTRFFVVGNMDDQLALALDV